MQTTNTDLAKEIRSMRAALQQLARSFAELAPRDAPEGNAAASGLSLRERQVLRLVAQGKRSKEIADVLDISVRTVDAHRGSLMKKLGIHSIAGLVQYALQLRRPRRKARLTAARRAALKLQGQYIGTMRGLRPAQKAKVKKIRQKKGIRRAIAAARKLAA